MSASRSIDDQAGGAQGRQLSPQAIGGAAAAIAIVANAAAVAYEHFWLGPDLAQHLATNPVGALVAVLLCLGVALVELGRSGGPIAALALAATLFTSSTGATAIAASDVTAPRPAVAGESDPEPTPRPQPIVKPWF